MSMLSASANGPAIGGLSDSALSNGCLPSVGGVTNGELMPVVSYAAAAAMASAAGGGGAIRLPSRMRTKSDNSSVSNTSTSNASSNNNAHDNKSSNESGDEVDAEPASSGSSSGAGGGAKLGELQVSFLTLPIIIITNQQ